MWHFEMKPSIMQLHFSRLSYLTLIQWKKTLSRAQCATYHNRWRCNLCWPAKHKLPPQPPPSKHSPVCGGLYCLRKQNKGLKPAGLILSLQKTAPGSLNPHHENQIFLGWRCKVCPLEKCHQLTNKPTPVTSKKKGCQQTACIFKPQQGRTRRRAGI